MSHKLTFKDEGHVYRVDGKPVDSVTQITKACINNSDALIPWAVSETIKAIDEVHHLPPPLKTKARNSWKQTRDKAADTGTIAHKALEKYLREWIKTGHQPDISGWTLNRNIVPIFNKFLEWVDYWDFYPTHTEERLYSEKYNYAGTIDAIGIMKGVGVIVDFKTGKNIYPEHHLQLGAYYQLVLENNIAHVPIDELWIIRLGRDGKFEACSLSIPKAQLTQAFISALELKKTLDTISGKNKTIKLDV